MDVQVDKTHYQFESYVKLPRWDSYYHQIAEALACKGKDVLYIGLGDNIVVDTLKKFGKNVKTLDLDPALKPDYVGSVTDLVKVLGRDAQKFDVIICAEVLEHIPYEMFEPTIKQLAACAKEKLILSLPNHRKHFRISISKPLNIRKAFSIKRPFDQPWDINKQGKGEHYWEIDAKGCASAKEVTATLKKYFHLEKTFIPFENTYHMFFILAKKGRK